VGGHALTERRKVGRTPRGALLLALLPVVVAGCASPGYRNHLVPAFAAPGPPRHAGWAQPVRLRDGDYDPVPGGIRLIRAERAKAAPRFALRDEEGRLHTSQSLRGRVVWVDLWAVWCGTCRAEFPFVQQLHERFEPNGLTVLAVCRNSPRKDFVAAVDKDWMDFAVVDASDQPGFPFPYEAFPTTALIDRQGRIRAYWQGHRTPEAIEVALRRLLAEDGPADTLPPAESEGEAVAGEALATSGSVLHARLDLVRDALPPGGYFEGTVTLDVDPGWFLSADRREGAVPLRIRFGDSQAFRVLDCRLPVPVSVETATGARAGHRGRLELPLWGLLAEDVAPGGPVELQVVATVQACDDSQCLAPSDLVLDRRLWVTDPDSEP